MTLHLARIAIDVRALAGFAVERRLGDDDFGYALHAALVARFGDAAPRPFRFLPDHGSGPHLLGYVQDRAGFDDAAALPAVDTGLAAVFDGEPRLQAMPAAWRAGARYGFEVRVRPVVRFGKAVKAARRERAGAWLPGAGEIDANHAARERVARDGGDPDTVDRAAVYIDWLARRLADAATLDHADLRHFRRTRTLRNTHRSEGRRTRRVEGPDALLGGTLTVADPAAFAALLARGVGRHGGFGYGMLLLAPPGRA
ncbi:type I-E CRISPR-associated protein Cas6/Cse3/CasE [Sphingomonas hankookensis]|uniref:Type I-E CRISPR-associated protein Cas6/Cse3/CasE n=1 Tax=Sphingomonas hengshuiensis TaxID=1609977 RepID=A0A2W4Z898_9SPHN|nr:MAG: type I-E CRISPR-associated protein Cas6/Cse3/CasE [Sphingomonas hengshuiensis]